MNSISEEANWKHFFFPTKKDTSQAIQQSIAY